MSEKEKHTPGFARFVRWDEELGADIRMGYVSEDAPDEDFRFAGWHQNFRNEADAREFVRRWNAHERLLAAAKAALAACQANIAMWCYKDEPALLAAIDELRPAIAKAEGGAS